MYVCVCVCVMLRFVCVHRSLSRAQTVAMASPYCDSTSRSSSTHRGAARRFFRRDRWWPSNRRGDLFPNLVRNTTQVGKKVPPSVAGERAGSSAPGCLHFGSVIKT